MTEIGLNIAELSKETLYKLKEDLETRKDNLRDEFGNGHDKQVAREMNQYEAQIRIIIDYITKYSAN